MTCEPFRSNLRLRCFLTKKIDASDVIGFHQAAKLARREKRSNWISNNLTNGATKHPILNMNCLTTRLAILCPVNYTNLGLVFTKPICSIMPFVLFSFSLQNGLFIIFAHTTRPRRRHYISKSTASCIQSPTSVDFFPKLGVNTILLTLECN